MAVTAGVPRDVRGRIRAETPAKKWPKIKPKSRKYRRHLVQLGLEALDVGLRAVRSHHGLAFIQPDALAVGALGVPADADGAGGGEVRR